MDAVQSGVEILSFRKGDAEHSDTDSTGATSECGYGEGRCIYTHNCDEFPGYPPFVTLEGMICVGEQDIIGTTRARWERSHTLWVWDWDDTLFPSSWINMQAMRLDDDYVVPPLLRQELDRLAEHVQATLEIAQSIGDVVIITNAEEGWVPLSCAKFTPSLKPLVDRFKVVSARTRYETAGIFSPLAWKMQCFEHEITAHFQGKGYHGFRNVISLGDSVHEREAMQRVASEIQCGSKTVKFPERPTLQDLITCHVRVQKALPAVASHDGDLDLQVRHDLNAVVPFHS